MPNPRTESLVHQFQNQSRVWRAGIAGVDDDAWQNPPLEGLNPIGFQATHLLETRHYCTKFIELAIENPVPENVRRAKSAAEVERWPGPDELLAGWETVDLPFTTALAELEDGWLDEPMETVIPMRIHRRLDMLAFLAHHEAYHLGQWGALRRAHGLESLFALLSAGG